MYLAEVRIKNFRKFGEGANGTPGLALYLKDGLNVLIGENDSQIEIAPAKLKAILEKIELVLDRTKPGLGTLNQLYIAAELLLLQREKSEGINLALIEEIEAHFQLYQSSFSASIGAKNANLFTLNPGFRQVVYIYGTPHIL